MENDTLSQNIELAQVMTNVEMERLLKAQRLAAQDVERGVTLDMVKKTRTAYMSRKHQQNEALDTRADHQDNQAMHVAPADTLRNAAIEKLLSTIEATESLEDQLRAKYNL